MMKQIKQAKMMSIGLGPGVLPQEVGLWYSQDKYDQLRAEVERLEAQIRTMYTEEQARKHGEFIATRCADIAIEHFNRSANVDSYDEGWRDCADSIDVAIKKEFLS